LRWRNESDEAEQTRQAHADDANLCRWIQWIGRKGIRCTLAKGEGSDQEQEQRHLERHNTGFGSAPHDYGYDRPEKNDTGRDDRSSRSAAFLICNCGTGDSRQERRDACSRHAANESRAN
jgi:hypothetical protein